MFLYYIFLYWVPMASCFICEEFLWSLARWFDLLENLPRISSDFIKEFSIKKSHSSSENRKTHQPPTHIFVSTSKMVISLICFLHYEAEKEKVKWEISFLAHKNKGPFLASMSKYGWWRNNHVMFQIHNRPEGKKWKIGNFFPRETWRRKIRK